MLVEFHRRATEFQSVRDIVNREIETYKSEIAGRIHLHSYKSRIKSEESFIFKANDLVRSGEINERHIFERINDILGFRLLCLYKSSLPILAKFVKETFKVAGRPTIYLWEDLEGLKPKRADLERAQKTGYGSIHFVAGLKGKITNGGQWYNLKELKFEIQCRTITQEAWAESQHDLYKYIDPPEYLKSEYRLLSKYLDAATDQMQVLYEEFERIRKQELANIFAPYDLENELKKAGFRYVASSDVKAVKRDTP